MKFSAARKDQVYLFLPQNSHNAFKQLKLRNWFCEGNYELISRSLKYAAKEVFKNKHEQVSV